MTTATTEMTRPRDETIYDMLSKPSVRSQIALALPRHLTPDRMIRVAVTTLRSNPGLAACDALSVLGCIVKAAGLGLEIDSTLGHAYMVPFKNKRQGRTDAQLIIGYKGYLALAHRSGMVTRFAGHVAHENDLFEYELGSMPYLKHKPNLDDPGQPIAVYACLRTTQGGDDFEVIGWRKVLEFQKKYGGRSDSPWNSDLEEMARKTAIRALAKRAPLSAEISSAAALDTMAENEIPQNLAAMVDLPAGDRLAARLADQSEASVEHEQP